MAAMLFFSGFARIFVLDLLLLVFISCSSVSDKDLSLPLWVLLFVCPSFTAESRELSAENREQSHLYPAYLSGFRIRIFLRIRIRAKIFMRIRILGVSGGVKRKKNNFFSFHVSDVSEQLLKKLKKNL